MKQLPLYYMIASLIVLSGLNDLSAQLAFEFGFKPYVINAEMTDSVLFRIRPAVPVTDVILEVSGVDHPMFDDGTNGDTVSGDGVYAVQVNPQDFISGMTPSDVFRPFVGFCRLMDQGNLIGRLNVFAEVLTDEIAEVQICRVTDNAQLTTHLLNIRSQSSLTSTDIFYILDSMGLSKDIDFLNIITLPSKQGNRFHRTIRNDVQGIGLPIFEQVNDTIVPDRYKGENNYPISGLFDGADRTFSHETGHQWIAFVGLPFAGCAHWSFSELATSIMGFDYGGAPSCQGLNFSYLFEHIPSTDEYLLVPVPNQEKRFNTFELYLMGLLPADSVRSFLIFTDQEAVKQASLNGTLGNYQGPADLFDIGDVIEQVGSRVPSFDDAQKEYQVYTVVVSPEFLSRGEMAFYNYFAMRGEDTTSVPVHQGFSKSSSVPFYLATQGYATMSWGFQGFEFTEFEMAETICAGEDFVVGQDTFSQSGNYTILLQEDGGCDTIVHLDLLVLPRISDSISVEICVGDVYLFDGMEISETGVFRDTLISHNGCDSIITLSLSVDMSADGGVLTFSDGSMAQTICVGDGSSDSIQFYTSSTSGLYTYLLTNKNDVILSVLDVHVYDFEASGPGVSRVHGISHTGDIILEPGDDLSMMPIADGCFEFALNHLVIYKDTVGDQCITAVDNHFLTPFNSKLMPNPAYDAVFLSIDNAKGMAVTSTVEVIDMTSTVVSTERFKLLPGRNDFRLSTSHLPAGHYLINIPAIHTTLKFIVAR